MKRYLLAVHSEADPWLAINMLQARRTPGASRFVVLIPATPSSAEFWTWTEERARAQARHQLDTILAAARALDVDATGEIGDFSTGHAIADVLRSQSFDDVVVLSLPGRPMPSLLDGLVSSVRRLTHIRVARAPLRTANPG